jgi:NADH:ubiquinone oxidoreductase subunit F (NADH-binding)/NADH:ubiquinone oxidoreductase subunit E
MSTGSAPRPFARPSGEGSRRGPSKPKGRQVVPAAAREIAALLGEKPRQRDLLIEYLHLIQDRWGVLSTGHLAALAAELRLAMAEVYEVATFYHNFRVVQDGHAAPAPATTWVCDSLTCALMGADRLKAKLGPEARPVACLGRCDQAPATLNPNEPPAGPDDRYGGYGAEGGYRLYEDCLAGRHTADEIIAALDSAKLRGLGGAGFPTARKWRMVRQHPGPRLMAVNGDESEPGTFKDRFFLLKEPHQFLEGMLIGAWAIEASDIYIYVRDEYPDIRAMLASALDRLRAAYGDRLPNLHLRRGAGAYICGEESAMLESIEGKRGLPRNRPPYPAEVGLFGRPTLINNVETLYWVRHVVQTGQLPPRAYSVSGRVREPGVKLAPAGISVRRLIEEHCGGMASGHRFTAYLPGGASGGILPAAKGDLPLDFGTLEAEGCFIGSAAIIVLSDQDDLKAVVANLMRFFEDESCGQCTPCRTGTEKTMKLIDAGRWDASLFGDLAQVMADASICGLGQAAANPLRSALKHFPELFR